MHNIKKKFSSFYKITIQKIFHFFYGHVTNILNPEDDKDILIKKVNLQSNNYKIFFCNKTRVYTDTVHDTAYIKDSKLINGPSYQYRRLKENDPGLAIADCKLNSVLKKGTPRIQRKFKGTVFSTLSGGGGNFNYWHWMFDILPRFHILDSALKSIEEIDYFLFPNTGMKFQIESLDLLNIPKTKRLSSLHYRHILADEIIITSHPYTLLNNPSIDSLKIPNWIFDYLRKKFLDKVIKTTYLKTFPEKIYINRKDSSSVVRHITNLDETEDTLKNHNFSSLTMSDYSFSEQVALFYNAKEVIGLHGAGFANIIFSRENTKIIEMRSNTSGDVIKNLAINNKLKYFDITCEPQTLKYNDQAGDIKINIDQLNKILSN